MTGAHRIRWFVYAGREKLPRTSSMRGTWGYDVVCSCGWQAFTGGAVKRHISQLVRDHKLLASREATR